MISASQTIQETLDLLNNLEKRNQNLIHHMDSLVDIIHKMEDLRAEEMNIVGMAIAKLFTTGTKMLLVIRDSSPGNAEILSQEWHESCNKILEFFGQTDESGRVDKNHDANR